MSKRSFDELFEAYLNKFGENFPTMMAPTDEKMVLDIMEECLKSGKPYDPYASKDFDPDADY